MQDASTAYSSLMTAPQLMQTPLTSPESVAPDGPEERLHTLRVDDVRGPLADRLADSLQLTEEDALLTVDHLIRSEQAGKHDHGLIRVPYLINSSRFGNYEYRPAARPVVESTGRIHVNGLGHLGYPVLDRFIDEGCDQAISHGICAGTSSSVYPSGALFDWAGKAAERGVGILLVATSPARVTSPGGRSPIVGTNPVCIGLPTQPIPFVSDTATSEINHGELLLARATGEKLPPNAAIGPDGNPTDDASRVDPARGLGALLPVGGSHKGFAIAMGVEMLVSMGGLTPGSTVAEEHGVFCIFLGPQLVGSLSRGSDWVRQLDKNDTRIPGWQSWRQAKQRRDQGVVEVRTGALEKITELL